MYSYAEECNKKINFSSRSDLMESEFKTEMIDIQIENQSTDELHEDYNLIAVDINEEIDQIYNIVEEIPRSINSRPCSQKKISDLVESLVGFIFANNNSFRYDQTLQECYSFLKEIEVLSNIPNFEELNFQFLSEKVFYDEDYAKEVNENRIGDLVEKIDKLHNFSLSDNKKGVS